MPCLAAGCCFASAPPEEIVEQRSYDDARATFRTSLVVHGPSPQPYDPVTVAPDATVVEYTSGGLGLTAWRSRIDPNEALRPAVVFLHGGFAFAEEDWEMSRAFRDAGYVVMTPILRGENGAPGDYTLYLDEVDDVVAAGRALAATPGVDASHVYVTGHSAGGTLAMLAAMHTDAFRAGTSLSGFPDTRAFVEGWPELVPYELADIEESRIRSPLVFSRSFRVPFRAYAGTEEPECLDAIDQMVEGARAAERDVQGDEVAGDHFTAVPGEIERTLRFFASVL